MTTPQPNPPLAPDELVAAGTERDVLEAFLDFHREVLVRKVSGVSELAARDRRARSTTPCRSGGWARCRCAGSTST
jgi:hypothetical protein